MMRLNVNIRAAFLMLALTLTPAWAQQYPGGAHRLRSLQGELVINSGFVNNLNIHTFHVYSFLFKPVDAELDWQQVPIVERDDANELKFTVTRTHTADFTLRDARVVVVNGIFELRVAQKIHKGSPYEDDSSVQVRRYVLKQTEDEERWVFQYVSSKDAGQGTTIEQALSPRRMPGAKTD